MYRGSAVVLENERLSALMHHDSRVQYLDNRYRLSLKEMNSKAGPTLSHLYPRSILRYLKCLETPGL